MNPGLYPLLFQSLSDGLDLITLLKIESLQKKEKLFSSKLFSLSSERRLASIDYCFYIPGVEGKKTQVNFKTFRFIGSILLAHTTNAWLVGT